MYEAIHHCHFSYALAWELESFKASGGFLSLRIDVYHSVRLPLKPWGRKSMFQLFLMYLCQIYQKNHSINVPVSPLTADGSSSISYVILLPVF